MRHILSKSPNFNNEYYNIQSVNINFQYDGLNTKQLKVSILRTKTDVLINLVELHDRIKTISQLETVLNQNLLFINVF